MTTQTTASTGELLALVLTLRPMEQSDAISTRTTPIWWGDASRSLLLNSIGRFDPELVNALHEPSKVDAEEKTLRPFTASTLTGRFPQRKLDSAGTYELRYTSLNDSVAANLRKCISEGGPLAPGTQVELDYRPFRVESVTCSPNEHDLAGATSYQGIAAEAMLRPSPAPRFVHLLFTSPTNFSSNGHLSTNKQNIAYPLPSFVFGSLLDHWNLYSPLPFPKELLLYVKECLVLTHFETRSRSIQVSGGPQLGMVGKATFKTLNYERYWMSLLQAMARYSFYAGVGAKTASGMGQCRAFETEQPSEVNE